jgi:hypothetical protein
MPKASTSTILRKCAVVFTAMAADPCPDHRRLAQIERFEQVEIEIGEVVDGVEALRQLRLAITGMGRRDHLRRAAQQLQRRLGAVETDLRMKEEQRPAAAAAFNLDFDAIDLNGGMSWGKLHAPIRFRASRGLILCSYRYRASFSPIPLKGQQRSRENAVLWPGFTRPRPWRKRSRFREAA